MMKYFGSRPRYWGDEDRAETPVGKPCGHCREVIVAGDDGWIMPYAGGPHEPRELAFHDACHMRGITGSVAHQQRQCSCYVPGATCGDDPQLTRRQAAEAAVAYWERHI